MLNQVICITGASGSGKTTLVEYLFKTYLGTFTDIPSILTRPPRGDRESLNITVTKSEFEALWDKGELLWKIENHGYLYGTRKKDVRGVLASDNRALLLISPRCIPLLMDFCKDEHIDPKSFLFLHILSPDEETISVRLATRGDSKEVIATRIEECKEWDAYILSLPYPIHLLDNSGTPEEFLKKATEIIFKK
jgi:guanylate kinase